jgi:hypothetical protein
MLTALSLLMAVCGAYLCYSRGYKDGCEDTRMRLSKPALRLARKSKGVA